MERVQLGSPRGLVALFAAALAHRFATASWSRPVAMASTRPSGESRRRYAASGENSIGEHDRAIRAWIDGGREGPRPQRNGRKHG